MEKKRTRVTRHQSPTVGDTTKPLAYLTMTAEDPTGFMALCTALNCATFAEALLRSAQGHHGHPDEAGLVRSFLDEAKMVLEAASRNVDTALSRLPVPAPGDQVILDDKLWDEMKDSIRSKPLPPQRR